MHGEAPTLAARGAAHQNDGTESDALQFWKQNESARKLPKLALVARKLLAISNTCTPVKGYFLSVD
jgi:hypothetical protein